MSFFQDSQGILARDLWVIRAQVVSESKIPAGWKLVPTTFEGVTEWVYIRSLCRPRDWTRSYTILYQNPGEVDNTDALYPLVVRIQGFIKGFNLSPLGNWNGEKETAVRAKQYISLCSHGQHEAWVPVLKGLRDIRQFAHNSLTRGAGRRVEPEPSQDNEIYISRRVFNKLRDGEGSSHRSNLTPMEDPEGWYSRVSSEWSVADKLVLCRTQPDGGIVPCNWLVFEEGDFVDVAATFDVCFRAQQGVNVNINILQVVQVMPKRTDEPIISAGLADSSEEVRGPEVIRSGFGMNGQDSTMLLS